MEVPGLSIAIIHGPNTYTEAYGKAELPNDSTDRPAREMTTNALFAICSTTKAFTSAATSIAIQDSKATESPIDWDTPVAPLIPEDFILENAYATKNITLEDALSHRSGMRPYGTLAPFSKKGSTPGSIVRAMQYMPLATPPRTKYHYSNYMYIAVSHALEQHTGEKLGAFMKKRIWDPLGMSETFFSPSEAKANPATAAKLVQAYGRVPTKEGGKFIPKPEHPTDVTLTIQIIDDGLISDLRDRVIPRELSLVHASGESFVGRIHSGGSSLMPPFPVEFHIDAAGVAQRVGLLLEPTLKDKKL